MTKKKIAKKKTSKAVAIRPEEYAMPQVNLNWGSVMSPATDQRTRELAKQVAVVYGVPHLGVNIMASQPYLNKEGRLYLLNDLCKGDKAVLRIKTENLVLAQKPGDFAVVKATIVLKDGTESEATGEASKESVKLAAVQQTTNMMAETRALNRAIWKLIAGQVYKRIEHNLSLAQYPEKVEEKIRNAGRVSAEEMNVEEKPVVAQGPVFNPKKAAATKPEIPTDKKDMERMIRTKVESSKDVNDLILIYEKLSNSKLYSKKFVDEMKPIISGKVDKLTPR